jgi:hypothetical protein
MRLGAAALAAMALPASASAAGVTLSPTADAPLEAARPAVNFGTDALRAEGPPDPDIRSLLKFNVAPASGPLVSAKLRVYATSATVNGPGAYTTATDWSESTVNYNTKPVKTSVRTDDKGAIAANSWVEYDVTTLVTGSGTYSFMLWTDSDDRVDFASREAASNRPELVLTYGDGTALTPVADAPVEAARASVNFAGDALRAEGAPDPDIRSYLMFNVPVSSAAIVGAKLRVYATSATVNGPGVYTTGTDWSESSLTYSNKPPKVSVRTDDKGAIAANAWVEYDVSSLVSGPGPYSFMLWTDSDDRVDFASREGANPPQLVLTYGNPSGSPTVAAVGDMACDPTDTNFNAGLGANGLCVAKSVSDPLVTAPPAAVLALGDEQYNTGSLAQFQQSYATSFGRLKAITRPIVGNHEYETAGAAGYFDYFNGTGVQAGPAGDRSKGYYSYDIGAWHLVALNSNCDQVPCAAGSAQEQWLRADLAAHPSACTVAYFHQPWFTSGPVAAAPPPVVRDLWQALYDGNTDLVLNGHAHSYERFAPQTPGGAVDTARGITEIVVGTGGKSHSAWTTIQPNSAAHDNVSFGFLQLTLDAGSFSWRYVPTSGTFIDSGRAPCH